MDIPILADKKITLNKLFPLLVLLLAILGYSNSLYSPFVLDDMANIVEDPHLYTKNPFSIQGLQQLSQTRYGLKRLIPMLTFAVDHHLSKGSIVQYHLTNIAIHLLAGLAVFFLMRGLFETDRGRKNLRTLSPFAAAITATGLWMLNPVQTNGVTYIVQRMTSLAALFYIASLACYIRFRIRDERSTRICFGIATIIFACMAFMSKENAFSLPIAIGMTEAMIVSPDNFKKYIRRVPWHCWFFLFTLIVLISPIIYSFLTPYLDYSMRRFDMLERLLTEARVVVFYISLLVLPLPIRMNLDHDIHVSQGLLSPPSTLFSILFLLALTILAFRLRRKHLLISYGIFWFFLTLLIESTVIHLELIFEHRLYLPSVGFALVAIVLIDLAFQRVNSMYSANDAKKLLHLFLVIILCLLSVLTTLRNNDWRDLETITKDSADKSPKKPRALTNYGTALGMNDKCDEAIPFFKEAIKIGRPQYENYLDAVNNTMLCLRGEDKLDEAIATGQDYLKNMPKNVNSYGFGKFVSNLATLHFRKGNYVLAYEYLITGLRVAETESEELLIGKLKGLYAAAYGNSQFREMLNMKETGDEETDILLSIISDMIRVRRYEKAEQLLDIVRQIQPDNPDVLEAEEAYGRLKEKNSQAKLASSLSDHPAFKNDFRYRMYMTIVQFINKRYMPLKPLVGWLLDQAERGQPDDPFIIQMRVAWLLENKRINDAYDIVQTNIIKYPDLVPLLPYAGKIYCSLGMLEKEVEIYQKILSIYPGTNRWLIYEKVVADFARHQNGQTKDKNEETGESAQDYHSPSRV